MRVPAQGSATLRHHQQLPRTGGQTFTAAVSLSFNVESLLPTGPLAGLSGVSSLSLMGGIPLVGNFDEAPEVPLTTPAWTFEPPALGKEEGWLLELSADYDMGPGR